MIQKNIKYALLLGCLFFAFIQMVFASKLEKQRIIVLTDIENEPDDSQSVVRLLLYSNQIDIKGIVATTSVHLKNRVAPETIRRIINAYGKVQPNLLKHEPNFPKAERLLFTVKQGLPVYGMNGVGDGKDSEGSEWIIKILDEDDERPLWISVWGGPNTLAQALWKIRKTKSQEEARKLISKLRVYTISDQDDSGAWIRKNFPDLFYIVSPGSYYRNATWIAMNQVIKGANNEVVSNDWLANNIQQGHGPLGALYPDVAYGMEGDTPSWLMLIQNGLNSPEHPNWGSWGGRYELYKPEAPTNTNSTVTGGVPIEPETRPIWTNADDSFSPRLSNKNGRAIRKDSVTYNGNQPTLWRWREDFQNDFAARMDWCTKPYAEANHPPVAKVNQPEQFTLKSGDIFKLDADGSYDPDGDALSYFWFQYPEAGTYKGIVSFGRSSENLYNVHTIKAPEVTSPQTIHFILKLTDKGTPALSRYKRVIITVVPK